MKPRRPDPAAARRRVERHSATPLVALTALPRVTLPLLSVLLLVGGLLLPPVPATVCFTVLVAAVAWLSYMSWPVVAGRGRSIRVLAVLLLVVLAVQSIAG